jgi:hypothetical protein
MPRWATGGAGIERTPQWYQPFETVARDLIRHSRRVDGGNDGQYLRWVPAYSRFGEGRMLVDPRTGQPVRMAP